MKNKGFTLVELLAVIVILGILTSMVTVSVNKILKDNKQKLYDIQVKNIIEGAKIWANENALSLPSNEGEEIEVTLIQLKQSGHVDKNITNPINKEPFNDNIIIKIIRKQNDYEFIMIGG